VARRARPPPPPVRVVQPAVEPKASLGRSLLVAGGSALGGLLGGGTGSKIGSFLANGAASILGMGAYEVRRNSLVSGNVPTMHRSETGARICHREFICDVVSSGSANGFRDTVFGVNPGNALLFPWLNTIAHAYQEYRVHGMIFMFKSNSADALNSTNVNLGSVMLTARYNASDVALFTSKLDALNEEFSISGKPSSDIIAPIECDPKQTPIEYLFVRRNAVPAGDDPKLYDLCNLHLSVNGIQGANITLGELWCSYDIELLKPTTKYEYGDSVTMVYGPSTPGKSFFFGELTTYHINGLNVAVGGTLLDTLTFPAASNQQYEIIFTGVATLVDVGLSSWSQFVVNPSNMTSFAAPVQPDTGDTMQTVATVRWYYALTNPAIGGSITISAGPSWQFSASYLTVIAYPKGTF